MQLSPWVWMGFYNLCLVCNWLFITTLDCLVYFNNHSFTVIIVDKRKSGKPLALGTLSGIFASYRTRFPNLICPLLIVIIIDNSSALLSRSFLDLCLIHNAHLLFEEAASIPRQQKYCAQRIASVLFVYNNRNMES